MRRSFLRSAATGLLVAFCVGCVGPGGGYAYDGSGGYGDYYGVYGADYGGWGPGYREGPYRPGFGGFYAGHGFNHGPGFSGRHAFRSAPGFHGMPFIPSHGGGGHSGGGHFGGGGHR